MHDNPFYPSFTLRPNQFFGREDYLVPFERALFNENSPDISFILTGTRGCGKTSLLHQFAILAQREHMDVIEATSADALERLRDYAGMRGGTTTKQSISPSLAIGGIGSASLGEISRTTASGSEREPDALLGKNLCAKLSRFRLKSGLLVIIDEAQKISDTSLVTIGNAVQQAITTDHRVGLILGGLPQCYTKVRAVKSCTFLHRLKRVNLWCMGVKETIAFLETMFARVPEIGLSEKQIYEAGEFTGGQPYLMQLFGDALYVTVSRELNPIDGTVVAVSEDMLRQAERMALRSYKENVLDNVLSGTREMTRRYIRAAYEERREDGLASTREIAKRLGMTTREANPVRMYALNTQVIQREGRGFVSFALPQCRYIFEPYEYEERPKPRVERWRY